MIISRYLNKDILLTMLATTTVLLAIFICNQFVRYLGDAAIGRVTAQAVLQLMLIQVPLLAGFMLPLGFYIAVLFSYGRFYAESQMTVLFSCGVSRAKLLGITFMGAAIVTLVVSVLMIWIEPEMAWYRDHILAQAAAASPLEKMAPGRFHVVGGRWVFYVDQLSRDHDAMRHVFAAEVPQLDGHHPNQILVADQAKQVLAANGARFIEFSQGERYMGSPGQASTQIVTFDRYGAQLPEHPLQLSKLEEFTPTAELWREQAHNPRAAAEFQWRLSMLLSVIILTLFAVPLARVQPRQGRFARFLPAVIVYTVYIDGLFVARAWVEKGLVSSTIGLWWVHALMLVAALVLCAIDLGWWRRVVMRGGR